MSGSQHLPAPVNVVLGASGRTGLECVRRLLAVSDLPTRAVVRNPEKLTAQLPHDPKLQVVRGDVTDAAGLREALRGARGVIFAASGVGYWSPSEVDFKGVVNTATVAKELGVDRVVVVSSKLVTKQNWLHPIRILLNNVRYSLMDYKLQGEDALRSSGVGYTIVRPGGLASGPGGQATIVTGQGDKGKGGGSIPRADVAAVCVEALTNPGARNVTLEITSRPGAPEGEGGFERQLKGLWGSLTPDNA